MIRWTLQEWCKRFCNDGGTDDSANSTAITARTAFTTNSCGTESISGETDADTRQMWIFADLDTIIDCYSDPAEEGEE